jgi:hypothetical protein
MCIHVGPAQIMALEGHVYPGWSVQIVALEGHLKHTGTHEGPCVSRLVLFKLWTLRDV